jgi:hypothetical protein
MGVAAAAGVAARAAAGQEARAVVAAAAAAGEAAERRVGVGAATLVVPAPTAKPEAAADALAKARQVP